MTQRISIRSQGCSANFGEGEQMSSLLQKHGFTLDSDSPCDLIVLNLCTVKGNGSAMEEVRNALQSRKALLVTGCVTPDLVRELRRIDHLISIANTHALPEIHEIVAKTLAGERIERLPRYPSSKLGFGRVRRNPVIGIVPVSNGCLDACTFCSTRLVKGRHRSFSPTDIIAEVRTLVEDGCKQIWLTGQDAGCYGFEWSTNLARLAQQILREVPGDYRLRLGMGNPRHILSYWEELAELFQNPRVFRFIHLPVQSGSDSVLARMGRRHGSEEFRMLVEGLRKQVPDIGISTDIIVGFPGERDDDFQATLSLLRDTRPLIMNTTRFVVRPGTPAAKMGEQVHRDTKKARSAELTELVHKISHDHYTSLVGSRIAVLVDSEGKGNTSIAHSENYGHIVLEGKHSLGTSLIVEITQGGIFSAFGKKSLQFSE